MYVWVLGVKGVCVGILEYGCWWGGVLVWGVCNCLIERDFGIERCYGVFLIV